MTMPTCPLDLGLEVGTTPRRAPIPHATAKVGRAVHWRDELSSYCCRVGLVSTAKQRTAWLGEVVKPFLLPGPASALLATIPFGHEACW